MNKSNENSYIKYSDPKKNERRLLFMIACYNDYKSYRRLYETAIIARKRNLKHSSKFSRFLVEKTWEAEGQLRIALNEILDVVNEIRDTGELEAILRDRVKFFSSKDGFSQSKDNIYKYCKNLSEKYDEFDGKIAEEVLLYINTYIKSITSEKDQLRLSIIRGEKEYDYLIDPAPQPGDLGRISTKEFFNPKILGSEKLLFGPLHAPVLSIDTCHSIKVTSTQQDIRADLYGSIVSCLAYTKEMFYRHARILDEVGLSLYEGRDDQLAIGIGLVIAGGALIFGGFNEDPNNWGLISFGVFLLLAGSMCIGASIAGQVVIGCIGPVCTGGGGGGG